MDRWNYGWEDPRGYEQQSFYGESYQECNTYVETYPLEEAYEPSKEFAEGIMAQLQASNARLQATQELAQASLTLLQTSLARNGQETMVLDEYPHEQAYETRKPSLEESLAQLQVSQARLQATQEMLIHSNEQLEASLARESPFPIYEHESFFDQEPNSKEEAHVEHLEQDFFSQVENDDSDVDVQACEFGYESSSASEVRDYTSEELVQFWNSKFPNRGKIFDDAFEEDGSLSSEEEVELEDIFHKPLIIAADIPKEDESSLVPCEEEVEEIRTFSPPTSMDIHHELPKVDCRTLSTCVLHEKIELEGTLPLNPPLSGQCFYNEVMDWKGTRALEINISHQFEEPLPPIVPMSIISIPILKEKGRMTSRRIEKRRKIKKLHFQEPIATLIDSSWSCLYDTSRSPLAPNNRVVVLEKYPP